MGLAERPLMLPGYTISEQIYTGRRTTVYRAVRDRDQTPVVIKLLTSEYPSFSELMQFRNQYAIAKKLRVPSIIQPYNLEPYGNSSAFVMEDFDGISLREWMDCQRTNGWKRETGDEENSHSIGNQLHQSPSPHRATAPTLLTDVLAIALQLCDSLHDLYHHRVIHKDLKPANILIHPETKRVKLIDFSIASLLPKETEEIKHPNGLEGTLNYLAPEQTGRMNRGIDYRSDFYSLGVTLFELLTGALPFQSNDPMELVHCHLAVQPPLAHSLNAEIPPILSEIVAKLMAKNAEDRYQSALGLKHDLERCQALWQAKGNRIWFQLAERDLCDRFIIPEQLYGREAEVMELLSAFNRASAGTTEMLLIAGFSGIGKTAVVNEVHKPIVQHRGYFIKGKFDQFNRSVPFSAVVQAFRDLMGQLLSESDAELQIWKSHILEALGEDGQVIIDVIPELEWILGKQPPATELSGTAAQNRFNLLFQQFIQVFTTPDHPLVMFLDDLQWADTASLSLIQVLMTQHAMGYLLMVGAYRNNEVSPAHPLILTLDNLRTNHATVNTITLAPLSLLGLNALVANTLRCVAASAQPLTELIYQKTQGNPFFATQFLKALYEDGWIEFDGSLGQWQCDIAAVRQLSLTDDVVEFMAIQLQKLPATTQAVLKLAAYMGAQFDLDTLAIVSQRSEAETATELWNALEEGLILPQSELYKFYHSSEFSAQDSTSRDRACVYRFLHDRVQQAAYSLVPDDQRQITHLTIGRLLLSNHSESDHLFEVLRHLNTSIALITDPDERRSLAQLNLAGCQRAKSSTAYRAAVEYAGIAIDLLPANPWETDYSLTLKLYEAAAEAAYLHTEFTSAKQLIQTVLHHSKQPIDCVKSYELLVQIYIAQDQQVKAIDTGLEALTKLGVSLIGQQNWQENLPQLPSIDDITHRPQMTDPAYLAALQILATITPPTHHVKPELFPAVALTMVDLCDRAGYSGLAAYAYGSYGLLLLAVGDPDTAHRSSQVSLALLERCQAREVQTKVNMVSAVFISACKEPGQVTLPLLKQGIEVGLEVGDIEHVSYCIMAYFTHLFLVGEPLEVIEQSRRNYLPILEQFKQEHCIEYSKIWLRITDELTQSDRASTIDTIDAAQAEVLERFEATHNHQCLFAFHLANLIACYTLGNYAIAVDHAIHAIENQAAAFGILLTAAHSFYHSLALLALMSPQQAPPEAALEQVIANQAKLQHLADHAPSNYLHKVELISAEICRIQGKKAEAIDWYDLAIAHAQENNYLQEAAIAHELAAQFYLEWGKDRIAQPYLIEAYYAYSRWGASAKIADLEQRYSQLLAPILQQRQQPISTVDTILNTSQHGSQTSTSSSLLEAFDLATILKASQTLSSEIDLENLLITLLQVMLERTGAEKCVLILLRGDRLLVEGIATTEQPVGGLQQISVEESQDIPLSLIYTVKHLLQPVVLIDASTNPTLANDPYISRKQPKSILCNPIMNRGQFIGILYLENNLAPGVFTNDLVKVLNLLCAQAAISLENAHLYEQSQATLTELRASEARFQKMANNIPGMVYQCRISPDGSDSILYVSSGCIDLYTVQPEVIMAGTVNLTTMMHPDDQAVLSQKMTRSAQYLSPVQLEFRVMLPDGTTKWAQTFYRPEPQPDGSVIWDGVTFDISDRKRTEAERNQAEINLRLSEERYRCLISTTSPIVWISAPDGQNVDSPLWCAYTGQDLAKLKNFGWLEAVHPDDIERTAEIWNHARETKTWYKTEYRLRAADGSYRHFDVRGVPILDEEGNIREWFGNCTDIEDRKLAEAQLQQRTTELEQTLQELQSTQTRMIQSEKMSGLGQLVAGVAHEINNPVNFIYGNLSHADNYITDLLGLLKLYQQRYPTPTNDIQSEATAIDLEFLVEDLPKLLSSMRMGAERIQKIVASLRTFSRMDEAEMKAINIHDGIDSTLMILQHRLKSNASFPGIDIIKTYGELPPVECYAGQLNQVFMNLLSNAIDALEDSAKTEYNTRLSITIRTVSVNAQQIAIYIADNGIGISDQIRQRLFDPFFTTKPVGKGTGMGLSISYQIVTEKHGGTLECVSEPGQGSTFIVTIPIRQG